MHKIEDKIKKIISKQFRVSTKSISYNTSFIKDLGADSLDIIELIISLEENFNLEIKDEEFEQITTIKEAINCIKFKLKK
ncbi:MAG: acyl carrier protein [Candidatus Makana argininalis]